MKPTVNSALASGLLTLEAHSRLISDLARLSAIAGIDPAYVLTPLADYCAAREVDWIKSIRTCEKAGCVVSGAGIETRLFSMAGALLRNYVDARVITLHDVIHRCKERVMPQPTVLLIPNFFIPSTEGGKVNAWQVSLLVDLLLSRLGQKTILGVTDIKFLEKDYGSAVTGLIKTHYDRISA